MEKLLTGKNILITGTARGMGKEMVRQCARNGADIWAHARVMTDDFQRQCRETEKEFGVKVRPICFDLSDPDAIREGVKKINQDKTQVDGLVNNAGIICNTLFQMTPMEEVRRQMEINFFAPYLLTQYMVKRMVRQKKGSIVNLSSVVAQRADVGSSAYGASKAALIVMTKSLAKELGANGIRANCILPGLIDTEMLSVMTEDVIAKQVANTALKRRGEPVDVANTVVFLLSDLSSFITGQAIRADGGMF